MSPRRVLIHTSLPKPIIIVLHKAHHSSLMAFHQSREYQVHSALMIHLPLKRSFHPNMHCVLTIIKVILGPTSHRHCPLDKNVAG